MESHRVGSSCLHEPRACHKPSLTHRIFLTACASLHDRIIENLWPRGAPDDHIACMRHLTKSHACLSTTFPIKRTPRAFCLTVMIGICSPAFAPAIVRVMKRPLRQFVNPILFIEARSTCLNLLDGLVASRLNEPSDAATSLRHCRLAVPPSKPDGTHDLCHRLAKCLSAGAAWWPRGARETVEFDLGHETRAVSTRRLMTVSQRDGLRGLNVTEHVSSARPFGTFTVFGHAPFFMECGARVP
ncbi:hypothetical protein AWB64_06100 [Caballeronia sordidicola]|uniref:Uncharacterized protein n=1 Tax=Caballeronia sordidicola TaxID=196367 RepID=A0A158IG94_CABSO|nr:hypothetical protein AWB64_06100 [Caballeronia sordidicola]